MSKLKFNLSPSAINLYNKDQLNFYYCCVVKAQPDTQSVKVYGVAGNVVHDVLEEVAKQQLDINQAIILFEKEWLNKNLHMDTGLNGQVLDKSKYFEAVKTGVELLQNKYRFIRTEEVIEFPLIDNDKATIKLKGIIDLQCSMDDEFVIVDWKTSSKVDTSSKAFKNQLLHYALLVYKKYGVVPKACHVEYVKINKTSCYKFTEKQVLSYEKEISRLANELIEKGFDINKYECNIDELSSPFNEHKKKIKAEIERRRNSNVIHCEIKNNRLYFLDELPSRLRRSLNLKYSYFVEGHEFAESFQRGMWDGKKYLMKKDSIPFAFVRDFQNTLLEYNTYYGLGYTLDIKDMRNNIVVAAKYDTKFKDSEYTLRYYQTHADNVAKRNMIGILALGTSAGKTIIATELIRQLNRRTLFVVNRIELVRQAKEELEKHLGVEVAEMCEGSIDTSKQITVASIQTLFAVLNRKDKSKDDLVKYLYNVTVSIFDECQNVTNVNSYGKVAKYMSNCLYNIGLSGTAWRRDGATLEMNALVGFPIYEKSTKELEDEGFICPTRCYFIESSNEIDDEDMVIPESQPELFGQTDYASVYKTMISENNSRNQLIADIANKYKKTKKILILTKLVKHATILSELIEDSIVITGSTKKDIRKKTFEEFKNNLGIVLIGSSKIFSTGINIPDLDIGIYTIAGKSDIDVLQTIGRLKRTSPGKTRGYFIDFNDKAQFFAGATNARKKALKKFSNEIIDVTNIAEILIE